MTFKKDDYVELRIDDIGTGGEGIGKVDGYTVFVKDAIIGDVIEAKIIKVKKNYGYGRLMKVIQPSEHRVDAKCSVARQCGGCQIQEMSYEAQLEFKKKLVKDNLVRIGQITDVQIYDTIGMEQPFNYRNKAQYPIGSDKDGNIVMGFYAGRTHYIVDNTECHLGSKGNKEILELIRAFMKNNNIAPYNEETQTGLIRHILIRTGYHTNQIMVCLIINGNSLPKADKLVDALKDIEGMTSIMININKKKTNVILGDRCETLWGKSYIEDSICGITYQISPLSFYQVNPQQTEKLYLKALEYANLTGNETVWDLYCGIGTISLLMSTKARKVYGVEIVPQAIEDARNNAIRNNIDNAEFFVGKAEEVVPDFYEDMKKKAAAGDEEAKRSITPDVVVVDPPRKGCEESLLETIIKMQPQRIVYVSCDSATLARDLKFLVAKGYGVEKVQPVDQFAHTVHVETVVLLSQRKADDVIEVEIELDELDLTSAESKATYKEIQEYVLKEHGLKVSNLYISQVKRKCGIEVGENYNLPKSEDSRQLQCPVEKEKAIRDALGHFGMI